MADRQCRPVGANPRLLLDTVIRERLIDVGFVVGLSIAAGVVMAIGGLVLLVLGGEYEEDE
jgi:hypothetical protein